MIDHFSSADYSVNGLHSQGWSRPKPRAWITILISHMGGRAPKCLGNHPLLSQAHMQGAGLEVEHLGFKRGILWRCCHPKWWFNLLSHNTGSKAIFRKRTEGAVATGQLWQLQHFGSEPALCNCLLDENKYLKKKYKMQRSMIILTKRDWSRVEGITQIRRV